MTTLLTQRSHKLKDFTIESCKIENKFIDEIHSSRRELIKKYYLGDLEQKDLKIVEEIYKNRNAKCLTGGEAKQFHENLRQNIEKISKNAQLLLSMY